VRCALFGAAGVRDEGSADVCRAAQARCRLGRIATNAELAAPRSQSAAAGPQHVVGIVDLGLGRVADPSMDGVERAGGPALGDLGVFARNRLRRPDEARGVLALRVQGEQAPNPDSRQLGTRRDRCGLPVAQVDWRPTASDRASIRATQEAIDEAFRGAGLGHVELMLGDEHPPALLEGNFHHLGATRMHTDPSMGVADADCRVHGVRNLDVAGSSVFPTYGCSNPTLTVVALALRLANHLKKQLAG
jgi:choline dehydrogenase-like flavoprotein